MDNRTMRYSQFNCLQRVAPTVLRLVRIAMAALIIAGATAETSASFDPMEFRSSITAGGSVQSCGGATDCHAGACRVISCFTYVAIESRTFELGSDDRDGFGLTLSDEGPCLSPAPQPHPPRI